MPLPRNLRAKNQFSRNKLAVNKSMIRVRDGFKDACHENKICHMDTFRGCKYSDTDGNVTLVEYESIKASLKHGITVVNVNKLIPFEEIYDVVVLKQNKEKRDAEKKLKDEEELARIKQDIEKSNQDNLIEPTEPIEPIAVINPTEPESINPIEPESINPIEPKSINPTNPKPIKSKKKSKKTSKDARDKALKKMEQSLEQRANQKFGNKHTRRFTALIEKFNGKVVDNIKYLEVKAETTDMIIEVIECYRIDIPTITDEFYYVFYGDIQIKNHYMKEIDQLYGTEKTLKEQSDFLERIKANESTKTTIRDDATDGSTDIINNIINDDSENIENIVDESINDSSNCNLITEIIETAVRDTIVDTAEDTTNNDDIVISSC